MESKRRWMDSVDVDLSEKGLSREETHNRAVWKRRVRYVHRPHVEVGKDAVEDRVLARIWIFPKKGVTDIF